MLFILYNYYCTASVYYYNAAVAIKSHLLWNKLLLIFSQYVPTLNWWQGFSDAMTRTSSMRPISRTRSFMLIYTTLWLKILLIKQQAMAAQYLWSSTYKIRNRPTSATTSHSHSKWIEVHIMKFFTSGSKLWHDTFYRSLTLVRDNGYALSARSLTTIRYSIRNAMYYPTENLIA